MCFKGYIIFGTPYYYFNQIELSLEELTYKLPGKKVFGKFWYRAEYNNNI